jgi:peptidoglycan/xylan/chitin deacetylase (PgdA/CDA1 family)
MKRLATQPELATLLRDSAPPLRRRLVHLAKDMSKRVVAHTGSGLNRALGGRSGSGVGILMYHRVVDHVPGLPAPTWNITPGKFHDQLAGLLRRGFEPWPLRRLVEYHNQERPVPKKVFVVTFDDGHESVYLYGWPVLRKLQVPATVFLATAFIDSQQAFPFDDWVGAGTSYAPIETWRPMSSQQCRDIVSDGLVELGAHTHSHQDFAGRLEEFHTDLGLNVDVLQGSYAAASPALAFPFGSVNKGMLDVAHEVGVTCGMTTRAMPIDVSQDPFGWGRFDVEAWDTAATLAAKLNGWYSWAVEMRRRVVRRRHPGALN